MDEMGKKPPRYSTRLMCHTALSEQCGVEGVPKTEEDGASPNKVGRQSLPSRLQLEGMAPSPKPMKSALSPKLEERADKLSSRSVKLGPGGGRAKSKRVGICRYGREGGRGVILSW